MRLFLAYLFVILFTLLVFPALCPVRLIAQASSPHSDSSAKIPASSLTLRATSTMNVPSELGGAFMPPSKCDPDGNLYIRKYAVEQPLLSPVVKIDRDGKRVALFDAAAFSKLALYRSDAFSPA